MARQGPLYGGQDDFQEDDNLAHEMDGMTLQVPPVLIKDIQTV